VEFFWALQFHQTACATYVSQVTIANPWTGQCLEALSTGSDQWFAGHAHLN
jgi:hypothetical protein